MDSEMQFPEIRDEIDRDHPAIRSLTEAAFRDMPYAGGDEQEVIDRLRSAGALAVSLVAVIDMAIVGHIAFSPAQAGDATHPWFALGPVSVLPGHQRRGIGSALIERGLVRIQQLGALGCILTGNPEYYPRFGFELSPRNAPPNEAREFFMMKCFTSTRLTGAFHFHRAFYGDEPSSAKS